MTRNLTLLTLFLINLAIKAQVVTSDPSMPSDTDSVTITFYADQGSAGLTDYSGDIYAHTGVITNESSSSSDWKYTKADWSENIDDCKLTKVGTNEYTLTISPSIREFYDVPDDETIKQIALVFRNSDGSVEGKDDDGGDIYVSVYEDEGLQVSLTSHTERWEIVDSGAVVKFSMSATEEANLSLYIENNTPFAETTGTTISGTDTFKVYGNFTVYAKAESGTETAIDSVEIVVQHPAETETKPTSLKDGVTCDGKNISFVLYAPGKENIYLVGDFNNWTPSNDYQLKKSDSYWWLTIEVDTLDKEYAFQYFVDNDILVTDPYVTKILDPSNDKYISDTIYPNLKSYPTDKTDGIVGVINPGKDTYNWGEESYSTPGASELVIYELHIRDFVESHYIQDVKEKLDYLEELGVNAIELMPINEFEGNSSWGYNPSFYFAPDKYYGTDEDYKDFIKECHKRGIVVFMDMVLNHAYGSNPMVKLYYDASTDQPTSDSPWFNETSPNPTYYWGYDFNHESEQTKQFVDSVLSYWVTEYHLDGFRLDFTKGFTNTSGEGWDYDASRIAILERIYDELMDVDSNTYLICEHLTANTEETALANYGILLWGNMNYAYMEATEGSVNNSDLSWQSYRDRGWNDPNVVAYMESHDEERIVYNLLENGKSSGDYDITNEETALERAELGAVFFLTIPGPKMIWQFGELGYDVSIDYNDRTGEKPIKWDLLEDSNHSKLYHKYLQMLELKSNYNVFNTSDIMLDVEDDVADKKIVLEGDSSDIFLVGNFDVEQITTTADFTQTGTWYDVFNDESITVTDVNMELTLEPGEYRLYSTKEFDYTHFTEINKTNTTEENQFSVYPNPASDFITIKNTGEETINSWTLITLSGQKLNSSSQGKSYQQNNLEINVSGLNSGMYLLRISTSNNNYTIPVIKADK